ncbi:S8 family serine peptidase [Colwellia psychrerythraea]|uniref:Peptidase S8 and S53 subtilisin kexin sedolisin n=1 Tax=Colwellia psychrerythraea TaxID=28229 RepID=A0A099KUA2_COLPS|nr:S8 family serine peptidase [Colwellia psychrerythraea]KGJ93770.1 peptidase S8 and S53 subtilisin kexin sedolisin [Colwellia psychrerythraea]
MIKKQTLMVTFLGTFLPLLGFCSQASELPKKSAVLVIFKKNSSPVDRLSVFNSDAKLIELKRSAQLMGKNTTVFNPFMTSDNVDRRFKTLSSGQMAKIVVPNGITIEAFKLKLKQNPAVKMVVEDKTVQSQGLPNDPLFAQQPSLHQVNDHDLDAPEAWDISTGSKAIYVAVIDTGIDYTHPDLSDNIWINEGEIPNDGIDNDGNGYIDDVHGIDTWNSDSDPMDGNDHGSNVAGIIGASGNNGLGITGVNHHVNLISCKAFSDGRGGSTSTIYQCLDYILSLKQEKGLNIRVINNSYSQAKDSITEAEDIAIWQMMVDRVADEDILFVVAASNESSDNDIITQMPGNLPNRNVITVASTRQNGRFAYSHSNYGLNTVHIGAPGHSVTTTESLLQNPEQPYYFLLQGTSFAAPHVSGAAALALSVNPNLTAVELKKMLMATGDKLSSLDSKTVSGKRVNLHKLLVAADSSPRLVFESDQARQIIKGQSNAIIFNLVAKNGLENTASLAVLTPTGITASLSAATGEAGQTVILNATATESVSVGEHIITLSAGGFKQEIAVDVLPGSLETVNLAAETFQLTPWLPDGVLSNVTLVPSDSSESLITYDVKVTMDINHEKVGELDLYLISPTGTKVNILKSDGNADTQRDIREVFYDFRGESAEGRWSVQAYDNSGGFWLDLDKIVGAINWTLSVEVAGGKANVEPICIGSEATVLTDGSTITLCSKEDLQQHLTMQVPESQESLTIELTADNGNADLYINFGAQANLSRFDCISNKGESIESCVIDQPNAGTYYIMVTGAADEVEVSARLVASNERSCQEDPTQEKCQAVELTSGISRSVSAPSKTLTEFYIDVTGPMQHLVVTSNGDNGDADLFVNFDTADTSNAECRSRSGSSNESCVIDNPQLGRYFISVEAYKAIENISLVAELIPEVSCNENCCDQDCGSGDEVILLDESNLSSDSLIVREVTVPAGKTLTVTTSGGTGDADLFVKFASQPLLWDKDCGSSSSSNDETCSITNTQAGTYYIVLDSYEAFTGLSLLVSYQ